MSMWAWAAWGILHLAVEVTVVTAANPLYVPIIIATDLPLV
jgi:hypothetical protein